MNIFKQRKSIFNVHHFGYILSLLGLMLAFSSCDKKLEEKESVFDTLVNAEPIEIDIETDLDVLLENKSEKIAQLAKISWIANDGNQQQYTVRVSPRGKTRRAICDFPPLKIKFSPDQINKNDWAPYTSLKLVTHCQGDENLVLKEYLTYKLYAELTEHSFRVQLAKINYKDAKGQNDEFSKYAFIIENKEEMADRVNSRLLENKEAKIKAVDAQHYHLLTFFQYMVGNTDWNLKDRHNIKLVKPQKGQAPIPVPYDFDYAGLVDAPYAVPHPQIPIEDVKERFFQWRGKNKDGFEQTLQLFASKKAELLDICAQFEWLDKASKTDMIDYIYSFYEIIEDEKHLEQHLFVGNGQKKCSIC